VLVVDETGDLKKGVCTVGVQRQYTGTAGRIENSQVAVYLAYAEARGHAMIDCELSLPTSWTCDDRRYTAAGVPGDVEFLTKPALATGMIARALDAGVAARWVAGDEVYGADPRLRAELELRRVGYVLAIGCERRVPTAAGLLRADELTAGLPRRAWQRLSAGAGAKCQRYYDWALISCLHRRQPHPRTSTRRVGGCWCGATATPASWPFYRCYAPEVVPLREPVRVAGRRWTLEESFQAGKGLAGLDEHQVRHWTSWRHWTPLATVAHAPLAAIAAIAAREHTERPRTRLAHRADLQRDLPPVRDLRHRTRPDRGMPRSLVALAATPPTPRPHRPLPVPRSSPSMDIASTAEY
jgi:SRSO17 transposase